MPNCYCPIKDLRDLWKRFLQLVSCLQYKYIKSTMCCSDTKRTCLDYNCAIVYFPQQLSSKIHDNMLEHVTCFGLFIKGSVLYNLVYQVKAARNCFTHVRLWLPLNCHFAVWLQHLSKFYHAHAILRSVCCLVGILLTGCLYSLKHLTVVNTGVF